MSDPAKVLLVDDDPSARLLLKRELSGIACDLVEAEDATGALDVLGRDRFAVAIVDVKLPGMDGLELTAAIRKRERNAQIPIIFLTGRINDDIQLERGYELGAVDFLEKSIAAGFLRAKVSVFADLDQRQRSLLEREREQQRIAHEQEETRRYLARLEYSLASDRALSSAGSTTPVNKSVKGSGPIKDRSPNSFALMCEAYAGLLDTHLGQLVTETPKPVDAMTELTEKVVYHGGGRRDLLDIHVHALEAAVRDVSPRKAEAYSFEGRLLALEMMGLLADHYRKEIARLAK